MLPSQTSHQLDHGCCKSAPEQLCPTSMRAMLPSPREDQLMEIIPTTTSYPGKRAHRRCCLSKLQRGNYSNTTSRTGFGRRCRESAMFRSTLPAPLHPTSSPGRHSTTSLVPSRWAQGGGCRHVCPSIPAAGASLLKGSGKRLSFTAIRTLGKHA